MTGTAVSAATYWRKTAVRFLRAMVIMPGCTVAHSWKWGLNSTTGSGLVVTALPVSCDWVSVSPMVVNS